MVEIELKFEFAHIQAPRQLIEQSFVETGRVLDIELRRCCQDFINHCSRQYLTSDLQTFLLQAENVLELGKSDETIKLSKQPFATAKSLKDLVAQAYRRLKDNWPQLKRKLSLYVSNMDTEHILISHIRKAVQQSFDTVDKIIRQNYIADEQLVIAFPSSEQINVLLI